MHELALHILDMVQNCIDAGANIVTLEIIEDKEKNILIIRVTDNGRGMSEETIAKVRNPFYTSRTTRKVGLGIPLVDMTTQQCGGWMKLESQLGKGTMIEAAYQFDHIDRPPIGNMINTLKSLLIGNQEIDFTYKHIVDGREFILANKELQEALGGVPLYYPDVLEWLDGFLQENFLRLYGGAV